MKSVNAMEAHMRLHQLVDGACSTNSPVLIQGTRRNAVLIAEDDWRALTDTIKNFSGQDSQEIFSGSLDIDECEPDLDSGFY